MGRGALTPFSRWEYNRAKLIEVTAIGDVWQRYLNTVTGEVVDTKVFYAEYLLSFGGR